MLQNCHKLFQIALISSFGMFQLYCKFFLKTFFRKLLKGGTIFVQARGSCHLPLFCTGIIRGLFYPLLPWWRQRDLLRARLRGVKRELSCGVVGVRTLENWFYFLRKNRILDVLTQKYGGPPYISGKKKINPP